MSQHLTRLNLIQEAINLGDEDIIALQVPRLPGEMEDLADLLAAKKYADAASWIGAYRRDNCSPVEYRDPEIAGLQMELAGLEAALAELLAEKNEALRKIDAFNAEYIAKLGGLVEEILELRLQQREESPQADDEELNQARREYEEFKQQQAEAPQTESLDAAQKKELKKLFRKSAHKCHPDQLPDDKKEEGMRMFQELEAAYRKQDLAGVREIWRKLEGGDWTAVSAVVFDKDLLRQRIEMIRGRISSVRAEIEQIYDDEVWQLIQSIADRGETWNDYFSATQRDLEAQLEELQA